MKLTTLLRLFLVGACMLAGKVAVHAATAEPTAAGDHTTPPAGGATGGDDVAGDGAGDHANADDGHGAPDAPHSTDGAPLAADRVEADGIPASGPTVPQRRTSVTDDMANPQSRSTAAAAAAERGGIVAAETAGVNVLGTVERLGGRGKPTGDHDSDAAHHDDDNRGNDEHPLLPPPLHSPANALKDGDKDKGAGLGSSLTPDERNAQLLLHPFFLAGMSGVTASVACALWLTGEKEAWTQASKDAQVAGKPTVTFGEYLKSRMNTWPSGKILTAVALAAMVGFGGYGAYAAIKG